MISQQVQQIPNKYLCSLTDIIMNQPVQASDQRTYEKKNITQWMKKSNKSPKTGKPFIHRILKLNEQLKKQITQYKKNLMIPEQGQQVQIDLQYIFNKKKQQINKIQSRENYNIKSQEFSLESIKIDQYKKQVLRLNNLFNENSYTKQIDDLKKKNENLQNRIKQLQNQVQQKDLLAEAYMNHLMQGLQSNKLFKPFLTINRWQSMQGLNNNSMQIQTQKEIIENVNNKKYQGIQNQKSNHFLLNNSKSISNFINGDIYHASNNSSQSNIENIINGKSKQKINNLVINKQKQRQEIQPQSSQVQSITQLNKKPQKRKIKKESEEKQKIQTKQKLIPQLKQKSSISETFSSIKINGNEKAEIKKVYQIKQQNSLNSNLKLNEDKLRDKNKQIFNKIDDQKQKQIEKQKLSIKEDHKMLDLQKKYQSDFEKHSNQLKEKNEQFKKYFDQQKFKNMTIKVSQTQAYIGQRDDKNRKQGLGKLILNNPKQKIIYQGSFKNDYREGFGKLQYDHGDKYVGSFKNGFRHGFGKYYYKRDPFKGDTYEGYWQHNDRSGYGKQFLNKNGQIYEGQWKGDQRSGFGKITYANKDVFEGNFLKNQKHGQGYLKLANGILQPQSWKLGVKKNLNKKVHKS